MSRWLKNVNALLENLDNQVEETVEEHRFNLALQTASAKKAGGIGNGEGGTAAAVEELLQEEAQGVDEILAKRGLISSGDDDDDDDDDYDRVVGEGGGADAVLDTGGGNVVVDAANEPLEGGGDAAAAVGADETSSSADPQTQIEILGNKKEGGAESSDCGGDATPPSEETINFDSDSGATNDDVGSDTKKDLFADAELVPPNDAKEATTAPGSSGNGNPTVEEKKKSAIVAANPKPRPKPAPASSGLSAANSASSVNQASAIAATVGGGGGGASLKELRKLRRHVLQLNSDLESAEREIDAQRQELDRAASRMERDRSRHKQERESSAASHAAEVAGLVASHERATRAARDANDAKLGEMEERIRRAERLRAEEGGERDADLAEALERERGAVESVARLEEERATADERVASLGAEVSRLETRLEHAASQTELSNERERSAEERLDKALTLHARQLGVRQRRESQLEQTVADLGAALVVAKGKVENAMRAGFDLDGDRFGRSGGGGADDKESLDLKSRLQDSQDDVETLRAQLSLERQRCSTLHEELQDLAKVQADELSAAHAKQRQYERKISDLTTSVAKLQSSPRRGGDDDEGSIDPGGGDGMDAGDRRSGQPSGDDKKETDHLRKEITALSEKMFEMQSKIDAGRGEISTLKNRLRSARLRAETAEKGLEAANQRSMMSDGAPSGMSSADEEMGLGRRAVRKRRPAGGGASRRRRRGPNEASSEVESIRSALGLLPGRSPSGSWREMLGSLLDAFDVLAVDLGSHFRHYPASRLALIVYLLILHAWAFFLLVYHAHAQGMADHQVGPETLLRSYRHMEQILPKIAAKANAAAEQASEAVP